VDKPGKGGDIDSLFNILQLELHSSKSNTELFANRDLLPEDSFGNEKANEEIHNQLNFDLINSTESMIY
jgi:hypothetical protein